MIAFLDAEIHLYIQKASVADRMLEKWIMTNSNITHKTRMNVYRFCVLSALLYSSETYTLLCRHLKYLNTLIKCLRCILNIKWNTKTHDTEILQRQDAQALSLLSKWTKCGEQVMLCV